MQRKRIVWSLFGGLLAELVNKISPLLILHFAARAIGVQGFGVAQFGLWLLDFAIFFVAFGYHDIGAIELGKQKNNSQNVKAIIGETLILRLGHMLVAIAALIICIRVFPNYQAYAAVLLALSFMLVTSALDMTFVLIGSQRLPVLSTFMIIGKLLSLIGIIYMVDGSEDTIRYAVLTAAANGFVNLASFAFALYHFGFSWPSRAKLGVRLRAATPYALRIFLVLILERFDMFIVEHYLSQTGTGLYAAPVRLVQSIIPLTITISAVFFSEMVAIHEHDEEARRRHLWLGIRLMILAFLPVVCGIWFVDTDVMTLIFGDEFRHVGPVLSVLMLGIIGQVLILVLGHQVLLLNGRINTLNRLLAYGSFFGILLGMELVGRYGLMGGALASVIARIGVGLTILFICRAALARCPVDHVLRALAPSACMVAVLVLTGHVNLYVTILAGAISYLASAATFNFRELKTIVLLARRRLNH